MENLIESSLPLPDNGKPIQVGDISFVYKNIYHPIYWVGNEAFRPRVETLIIKNGKEIFLRLYDTCEEGSIYRYRIPGGAMDNDSPPLEQAIHETNEEALIDISNVVDTGISYYSHYNGGKLLKDGDICIDYKGAVSSVFIGKYNGKFDKNKIEKHDLDNDMANNGKFYPIIKVCQLLRPDHIEALMNSSIVDDNVKGSMRLISRGDTPVTESAKLPFMLYHGGRTLYDELRPTGIDFGNAFQKAGWSLFCWTKYSSAIGWGVFSVLKYLKSLDENVRFEGCKNSQTPIIDENAYNYLKENLDKFSDKDKTFYVYSVKPKTDYKLGLGHSSNTPNCITVRKDHIVPDKIDEFALNMSYIDKYCMIVPVGYKVTAKDMGLNGRATSFLMTNDYMYNHKARKPLTNAHNSGELLVGDDITKFAKDNNIPINKVKFSTRMHDILHESVIPEGYYDTIVFDFGDVLDRRDKNYMYTYYAKHIPSNELTIDEFKSIIKGYFKYAYNKYGSFKTGKNIDESYKQTLPDKYKPYYDNALECMVNMGSLYEYSIPMLKSLKDKGYKLYYLTNKSKWNWENHGAKEKLQPLMNYFESGIVSCDVGVEKPDVRIYKLLIKKTGLNPETTLFIDDKIRNTMAAEKVGMTGIVFSETIVDDIMNLPPVKDTVNESTFNHNGEPIYFYHMVPKGTVLNPGITSLEYQYRHNQDDLFNQYTNKYRNRISGGWGIYPDTPPEELTTTQIRDALNKFRHSKYGCSFIYLFRFPPYKELGKEMREILKSKDLYRIDLNEIKDLIEEINYGHELSNTDNNTLDRDYYMNVTPSEYFDKYTEKGDALLFSYMNHISIRVTNNYIPKKYCTKIDIPDTIDDIMEDYSSTVTESVIDSRDDIMSKFLEKGDTCANLQNWDPNGYNILYVTGLSGSGKTTLATDMRKEFNCYRIELDLVAQHLFNRAKNDPNKKYKYANELLEEAPQFVVDWLTTNYDNYDFDSWEGATDAVSDFVMWMDTTHRGDGNLYIVNGAWIPELFDAGFFKRKPIIVKNPSYIKTVCRRISRDFKYDGSIDRKIELFIKNLKTVVSKGYRDAFKHDRYFKDRVEDKAISVESTEVKRSELPDEIFGIPSERKYPLDTEKHVRSAIKLFNYVKPEQEEELANNIIRRMNEFDITDIEIGEKNRFSKYYNA